MKLTTKVISILLTLCLIIGFWIPSSIQAGEAPVFDLGEISQKTVILHTNDTHGRVQKGTDSSLGIATVAAFKKACEAAGAEVILLDAGDTLHGKPIATIDQGATIATLLNACGYDAMTLGNHDYNYGSQRVHELEDILNFPILAANVTLKADDSAFVENHIILERNGVKYGIFGLSTKETETKTNPDNVKNLNIADPTETAKAEVAALQSEGADIIIALGHIGIDGGSDPTSADILKQVEGIDLFIDGHSHSSLDSCTQENESGSLLVSNGEYLKTIGCVVVDQDRNMTAYSIGVEDLEKAGIVTTLEEGQDETVIDTEVGTMIVEKTKELDAALGDVVANTALFLDGAREHVRCSETNLGNLAADAIRYATDADVALTNGGGIRTSIEAGDITKGMLAEVFPFGNIIQSKQVTGQAIKDALEHGVSSYPDLSGGYPQTSGITYTMDPNQPVGSRISNILVNGVAMDYEAVYVLASNDFTFKGGDGYTMIGNEVFPVLYEFGALDEELIHYMQTEPKAETYAVGRVTVLEINTEETVEEQPKALVYKVVKGDYLRKIAKSLFGDESLWKQIYEWNKENIKNPDLIFIGQELTIIN